MIIQISSGQGPEECCIGVSKLAKALVDEFPGLCELSRSENKHGKGAASVTLYTDEDDTAKDVEAAGIVGTICWIWESEVRKGHKRKNWYLDVSIIPEIEDVPVEGDIVVERFHSGGNGGQNVNKVETGVRVIHVPTGLKAFSTDERSQYMNKNKALKRLYALLSLKQQDMKANQKKKAWANHNRLVRGNPVRIYEGIEFKRKK